MKISLMNIETAYTREIELGTCEECFRVERGQLPEAEFLVDGEFYFVELYDKDDYNYSELKVEDYNSEKPDEFGNIIDFAYWLNENDFRDLGEGESVETFLYDLAEAYFEYESGLRSMDDIKEIYMKQGRIWAIQGLRLEGIVI